MPTRATDRPSFKKPQADQNSLFEAVDAKTTEEVLPQGVPAARAR